MLRRSLPWAPTIALSWLWGLGFFYAIHITFLYGAPGFLAFALPNAVGLGLFGWAIDRFGSATDLDADFQRISARYGGILLTYQVVAVAITVYALAEAYLRPLLGPLAIPVTLLVALVGCATGHVLRIQDFKPVHAVLLAVGLVAALSALLLMPAVGPTHRVPTLGPRFFGLIVPSLVGFVLGPWLDLQQWQRALRIRAEGGSIAWAYAAGGTLFFCLISVNALFAAVLPAAATDLLHPGIDGVVEAQPVLALTLAAIGPAASPTAWLFGIWAAIATISTLDSAYAATRWHLVSATSRSTNAIFALLPKALVQTPLWMLAAALAIAGIGYAVRLPIQLLIAPFSSLFLGYAGCLLLQSTRRQSALHDPMLCFLLGTAAAACLTIGYYLPSTPILVLASLLPLLAPLRLLREPTVALATPAVASETTPAAPIRTAAELPGPSVPADNGLVGRFEGQWFQYDIMPTYDDTNSVGNVYFANYVRWVGKTRELFFAKCVPNFDLKTTGFFILTRDFYHKFMRETREFEAVLVRIRVGKYNRKFVTLEHEVRGADGNLLGKGTQQLMFVDVASYGLIDVPVEMLQGFVPYVSVGPTGP
jgi:acyl-CoA thioesterase FadM